MNAIVTLESILEPSQALAPATLFGTGQIETILSAIESQVRAEAFDITTEEGRTRVKSVAHKVARSKTTLDEIGKEHVAHIKAQSAAIDKERKALRDRLDALKDEVRGPLTKWEEDEANRISGHENALVFLIESTRAGFSPNPSPEHIRDRIVSVKAAASRSWQEFHERAETAASEALATLATMLATAEQAEAERAELEALRKEKAERDARDAAERQRLAAEQAEAERQARRDAEEAARQEQLSAWKAEQEERAKRQAEEAAAIAVEQERRRQEQAEREAAAKKAAEDAAERKRQENTRHRAKVHKAITLALSEVLTGNADEAAALIEAIAAGRIPHISINY